MRHVLFSAALALAAFAAPALALQATYTYSGPADQPVVSLDYQGSRLKRLTSEPVLSIFADGRVVMPRVYAQDRAWSGQISQAELQGLLDLIIAGNDFFAIDAVRLKAQVATLPGPRKSLPADLATTVIAVKANHVSKTVRYAGLGYEDAVPGTDRLIAIRQRLEQIMAIVRLGGRDGALRWLDLANRALADEYPGTQALTLDDVGTVAFHNDGSAHLRFARSSATKDRPVSVTIAVPAQGEANISVARDDGMPGHASVLTSTSARAAQDQLTFVFTYTDAAGVGFNDATQGAARRAALDATAALLASYFPGYTATIHMSVDGANTEQGTLAAAGSNTNSANACDPGFGSRGDVGVIALGGVDPAADQPDGTVTVNFAGQTWGLGDTIPDGEFDFKSTLLHELMHAMGFAHSINQDGSSACSQAVGTPGAFNPYDQWIGDSTTRVIDPMSFILDATRWGAVVTGGAGTGAKWLGPQGKAGNGGQPVPLYSPTTYSEGSSISHLDDDYFTSANYLMEAATDSGQGVRTLSDFEVGMLKDIGFANATNQPGTPDLIFANGFE